MKKWYLAPANVLAAQINPECHINAVDENSIFVDISDSKISAHHSTISNSTEMHKSAQSIAALLSNQYEKQLLSLETNEDHILINDFKLHLPAMIFSNQNISLQIGNLGISFHAADALFSWASKHVTSLDNSMVTGLVQVPYALEWKSHKALADCNISEYKAWDWTFSSEYCFTMKDLENQHSEIIDAKSLSQSTSSRWQKRSDSGINMAMLQDTSVPILFYDDIPLYQDDLDDCGEVQTSVKIRVMPNCWLVLFRFFMRVDDKMIRLRESRLFHEYKTSSIFLDISWKEVSVNDCKVSNVEVLSSSSSTTTTTTTTTTASCFNGGGWILKDSTICRDPDRLSRILPSVDQSEGIHCHYEYSL